MKRFTDLYWRLDSCTGTNDKVDALRSRVSRLEDLAEQRGAK